MPTEYSEELSYLTEIHDSISEKKMQLHIASVLLRKDVLKENKSRSIHSIYSFIILFQIVNKEE